MIHVKAVYARPGYERFEVTLENALHDLQDRFDYDDIHDIKIDNELCWAFIFWESKEMDGYDENSNRHDG